MLNKNKILVLFSAIILCSTLAVYSMTTEDFLNNSMAKQRTTRQGAEKLLETISNEVVKEPDSGEMNWLYSAMLYFMGDYYETDTDQKKQLFTLTKDYALRAVKILPESADAHYWLAVGYGKWSEANGILESLFYADDILNEITKVIELSPGYFRGVAWSVRAKVYDFAPGWPLSVGNKELAYKDIQMALKVGPDFRFNYQMYAEILMNDGLFQEAKEVIEKGLGLPLEPNYQKEEEKIIHDLNKDLETVKVRLNIK